jgi:sigma-E factor negative regulatory protein RseA
MVQPDKRPEMPEERWSALVDGEAGADEVSMALSAWKDDAEARRRWHAYQLIGDTLRSQELASSGQRDADFLAAVRARLAREPVVLAPQPAAPAQTPAPALARRRLGWAGPAAVAAGFMAVAGVLVVTRLPGQAPAGGDAPQLAATQRPTPVVTVGSPAVPVALPGQAALQPAGPELISDGQIIRDARLNQYLQAHRGQANRSVLVLPSGEVLRVDAAPAAGK